MSTCEVWVRGLAENSGPFPVDQVYQTGWPEERPLPRVESQNTTNGIWYYYGDQYGGHFFGAGWRSTPEAYLKNCVGTPIRLNPDVPHDCINGACLPRQVYNTPGVFGNLASCQSGCAKNSDCKGECVSIAELQALQQAASQVKTRICG